VSRAALESLAENFSDGVVAPLFWFLLGGLPGLLAYKAINTLDSMIGYRDAKFLYFGRVAARLDDVANWPAARIAGALLCIAALLTPGASAANAWRAMWRDAGKHGSPNAGWPEAAMAGALGLALAGPRDYGDTVIDGAWMGDGRSQADVGDITRGIVVFRWSCGVIALALTIAVLA
jgi:adenosylcobinamide-phosphate synthase